MEAYKKPMIVYSETNRGIFPAVAGAIAAGLALGLAKGRNIIDSAHTQVLNQRVKNYDGAEKFCIGVI